MIVRGAWLRALVCISAWLTAAAPAPVRGQPARAPLPEFHHDGFDGPETSWQLEPGEARPDVLPPRRHGQIVRSGSASEHFVFTTRQLEPPLRLTQRVPPARVFDELEATLWLRSNRPGARVGLRLRLPHQVDPRTGQALTVDLPGETYSDAQSWQRLRCRTTDAAVQDVLARVRSQWPRWRTLSGIDTRGMYVDQVVLHVELQPGATEFFLDELQLGPLVEPSETIPDGAGVMEGKRPPRITLGDDRLLLEDRPFLPLFLPYHGEKVDDLAQIGVNVVWIKEHNDELLLRALEGAGLYAMAEPPEPPASRPAGGLANPAGLTPLAHGTERILFWNLGSRVEPGDMDRISAWEAAVREADQEWNRPLIANVMGSEREFHRRLDVVGSSRFPLHTSTSPRDYRLLLESKRKLLLPDKPCFTNLQIGPASATLETRPEAATTPVVEPEQIWWQAFAAFAAGYKGINYWKYGSLEGDEPGAVERRLAITLLNRHLGLLERWLATGRVVETVPATLSEPATNKPRGGSFLSGGFIGSPHPAGGTADASHSAIQAAVLQGEDGLLVLPMWYEEGAQFQPGAMAAGEIFLTVAGGGEYLQAWEVTTTSVSPLSLEVKRVSGGTQIRLKDFDQSAAIVLTSDATAMSAVEQEMRRLREACARAWVDLAAAKLLRVEAVQKELEAVEAAPVRQAGGILAAARREVERAGTHFDRGEFDQARHNSRASMRLLRELQRAHWEQATAKLTSGVSSPHTICFQTLPDHWRMMASIGRRKKQTGNLLRSGDFEDRDTMFAHRWEHEQTEDPAIRPDAALDRGAAQGKLCLWLRADPAGPGQVSHVVQGACERFVSPPISVYGGQILMITGQVRVASPIIGSSDGLVIYDSLKGTIGALRWSEPTPGGKWKTFNLIREVRRSGEVTITVELRGLGEAWIDDLRVVAIEPE